MNWLDRNHGPCLDSGDYALIVAGVLTLIVWWAWGWT